MNVGKTLFAQVMEFVPWKTFGRIESLRDIETCLAANQAKLFHMGPKAPPARSTLADALNLRDWRIYHALAQRLIARARVLYTQDPSVPDLDASVYALDATTIDLCLPVFPWAHFRKTDHLCPLYLVNFQRAPPSEVLGLDAAWTTRNPGGVALV